MTAFVVAALAIAAPETALEASGVVTAPAPPGPAAQRRYANGPPVRSWYGWQIMAADGGAIALLAVQGNRVDDARRTNPGLTGQLLGIGALEATAPLLHLVHGHTGPALLSAALRAPAALFGTILALRAPADAQIGVTLALAPLAVAAGGGMAMAFTLDWLFLSAEFGEPKRDEASWVPQIAPAGGGTMLAWRF
jgi:hypothetical protein